MLTLHGEPPTAFTGYLKGDDYADVSFEWKDGSLAHLVASRVTPRRERVFSVHSGKEFLNADLMNKKLDIYSETTINNFPRGQIHYSDIIETPRLRLTEPLKAELESFIECVETRTTPTVDGLAGLRALQIATQVMEKLNGK
jgi:predicted dehydrogenase